MTAFVTIDDFEFDNKTTLVRVDFNSPVDTATKTITDDTRIRQHSNTIKELMDLNAKVVILAHQGRKGNPDFTSLQNHANVLSTLLNRKIGFVHDLIGETAQNAIKGLKPGEALVLDNVRGSPDETAKKSPAEHSKSSLVTNLAPLADVFVMDGFAVAHRSQASVVGFSSVLPCVAGRVMERELRALDKVKRAEEKPCIYVLGGAKADDAAAVGEYVLSHDTADYILTGGVIGHLFLHAKGIDIGPGNIAYLEKRKFLQYIPQIQALFDKYPDKILTPIDFGIDVDGSRLDKTIDELPTEYPIFDIGPKTVNKFQEYLQKAKIVVLSGPMGVYERSEFMLGTKGIFTIIAQSNAFSVAGGGNTIEALEKLTLSTKISYISTGGGALMEYLTGKTLPGVQILTTQ